MTPIHYVAYAGLSILLCVCSYKLGHTTGRMEQLLDTIEWVLDVLRDVWHDQGPDDPAPEEVQ